VKTQYIPSKDEFILKIHPIERRANKKFGPFKLWWDDEGNIRAIAITKYTEELEEFRKNLHTIQLRGIWKGIKVTAEDIREARGELLRKLEEKW
jgi:hypothetical protein